MLLLYHEPEHRQNENQGQSSVIDIKGLETQQMYELNFNVDTGLYDSTVNKDALDKLARYIQQRFGTVQEHHTVAT